MKGQSIMMIASNGLGAMFGNFLAGYAIDRAAPTPCWDVPGLWRHRRAVHAGGRAEQDMKSGTAVAVPFSIWRETLESP